MIDVVRVWMYKFDKNCGDKKQISQNTKDNIINEVVNDLINFEKNNSRPVDEVKYVKKTVVGIIKEAEKLEPYKNKYKDKADWIADRRKCYEKI